MTRRSLSQAISVDAPDVKEFLKAGVPASKVAPPKIVEKIPEASAPAALKEEPTPVPVSPEKPKAKAKLAAVVEERQETTVPVTFRLPERLVTAMIQASADRKIRRVKPSTQQDMAALAIEDWLKQNSYL